MTVGGRHWTFFTNHFHVLLVVARHPDARLRSVADEVGITERAAHRILGDLVRAKVTASDGVDLVAEPVEIVSKAPS